MKPNDVLKSWRDGNNKRLKNSDGASKDAGERRSSGNQRQQQELIEETRKAARELERLSRERRDPQMQELSRQLNQTADEMQKAQASARNNSGESIAQNETALERLRQAQQRLQQMNGASGQRWWAVRIGRTATADLRFAPTRSAGGFATTRNRERHGEPLAPRWSKRAG